MRTAVGREFDSPQLHVEYTDWLEIYDFVMMPFNCAYCDQREEGYDAQTLAKFREFMRAQSPMNAPPL